MVAVSTVPPTAIQDDGDNVIVALVVRALFEGTAQFELLLTTEMQGR